MRAWFKQKRWAFYALLGFAGAFLLILVALVALGAYRDWLIKTYTVTAPKELAAESSPAEFAALKAKWDGFAKELASGQKPAPLRLSADEINEFINHVPGLSNKLRVNIEGDVLKGDFSVPLGKPDQPKLRGRYINGQATFAFTFEEKFPTLTVATLEANGRPIPRWLLKKIQRKNLVEDLDHNYQAKELFGKLAKVEVRDGQMCFVPERR